MTYPFKETERAKHKTLNRPKTVEVNGLLFGVDIIGAVDRVRIRNNRMLWCGKAYAERGGDNVY